MRQGFCAGVFAVAFAVAFASLQSDVRAASTQAGTSSGEVSLGSVTIGRNVTANGEPLKRGTYRLRVTPQNATPVPVGQTPQLERWVEFLQGGKVVAREVVTIVPQDEIAQVANEKPPRPGTSKVELLKGNDYLRIWVNRGGTNYLIHLPTGATAE